MARTPTRAVGEFMKSERRSEIESLCNRVFGRTPDRLAFPGGRSRSAFMADVDNTIYVLAKRDSNGEAILEGIVMKCLSRTGYVPNVIKVVDEWVVQEFIDGMRLPILIDRTDDMAARETLLDRALDALSHLQRFAHEENLHHRVPKIRPDLDWSDGNLGHARKISEIVGVAPPLLDYDALEKLFKYDPRDFIKGDARPGNAMVTDDRVVWFDWEGCGRRHALDDLAFVLADEWTAVDAATEQRLVEKHLPGFCRGRSLDEAHQYLMSFGILHMLDRAHRAIRYRHRDGKWWNRETCLMGDKIGVTRTEVGRMLDRSRRWSQDVPHLRMLAPWVENVAERLDLQAPDVAPADKRKAG